jgi:Fic family protein
MSQLRQPVGAKSTDGSIGGRSKEPNLTGPGDIGLQPATFGPVGWETLPWQPGYDIEALSRRKRDALPSSCNAAIPAGIADLPFEISSALAAEAEDAAATIIKLDAYVSASFGAEDIAPMQSVLLRSESAASSQIENLTVGAIQLAIAELGGAASKNAELVSKNVRAMDAAIRLSDKLDTESILAMHVALLGDQDPKNAGSWRDVQVWIGASGLSPAGATFIPPHADRVPEAMEDLARFLARNDLPVLVHAAIAHAQFETIHPFTDGNGRTGRALLHAMLRHGELTSRVTVPISAGLLTDTRSYFDSLTAYRAGDMPRIVEQVCDASRRAAGHGRWLVDSLAEVQDGWAETMQARAGSAGRKLLNVLIGQPAINVAYVELKLAVSNTAARRAVEQAVTAGILVETSDRKRDRVFLARDVIDVLDEFSERAGRRA